MLPLFNIPGYEVKYLTSDNIPIVDQLVSECSDYYMIVNGTEPAFEDTLEILNDLPPGKVKEDKLVIGIFNQNKLSALADVIKNYPCQDCWWIGLLLVTPAERRAGLGSRIYHALEKWTADLTAKEIRLGVVEKNEKAIKFWSVLGFNVIEKRPPVKFGLLEHNVLVMKRTLT